MVLGSLCCGFVATVAAIAAPLATYPRPIVAQGQEMEIHGQLYLDIPALPRGRKFRLNVLISTPKPVKNVPLLTRICEVSSSVGPSKLPFVGRSVPQKMRFTVHYAEPSPPRAPPPPPKDPPRPE